MSALRVAASVTATLLALAPAAAPASDGPGTTAFQFLSLGSGARIEALGEAGTAVAEGVDALVWNPARLGVPGSGEVSASYFNWLQDVQAGHAGATWPLGRAAVGVGFRSLSVSDFGNVAGEASIDQSDLAVSAGGAYSLTPSFHAGLGLKVIRSSLAGRDATGWAGDAGLDYRWVQGWDIVAAVRNFGPAFGYVDGVGEKLPTQAALGLGSTFGELRVDSEVLWESGPGWVGVLGAEYLIRDRVALRLGSRLGENAGDAREPWAAGVGIRARPTLDLEYAFRDGTFDASHRVGIRWIPGRSLGTAGASVARSPREFYVDVLNEALERSLVTFPTDVEGKVIVRSTAEHKAAEVISDVLAERLRERGVDAEVGRPEMQIPDDIDPEMRASLEEQGIGLRPDGPVVECEIVTSQYEILSARRARWVGPRSFDRRAAVDLKLSLTLPEGEEPLWSATATAEDREVVPASAVPASAGYPHAGGTVVAARKLHPLVEPAIVGALVTGLAVIFFSNRDVGQ